VERRITDIYPSGERKQGKKNVKRASTQGERNHVSKTVYRKESKEKSAGRSVNERKQKKHSQDALDEDG